MKVFYWTKIKHRIVLLIMLGMFVVLQFIPIVALAATPASDCQQAPTSSGTSALDFFKEVKIEPVYSVLKPGSTGAGESVRTIWNNILQFVNGIVVILLIAVAFAQILRININTYGVKKILPTLILAVIAANFSYLFCRLIVDFANIIMSYVIGAQNPCNVVDAMNGGIAGSWADPASATFTGLDKYWSTVFWFLIYQLLLLTSGVLIYILDFLFFARMWLIYFLVPIAPLAFMAMALPQTNQYFKQWWSLFSKWAFMPVVSIFWIWLGALWLGSSSAPNGFFMQLVFGGACFYMAITSPFKLGGAITGAWGKLGKQAWERTGGAVWKATGGAGVDATKKYFGSEYDLRKRQLKSWSRDNVPGVKQINARIGRNAIQKDLSERKLTKEESIRKDKAVMAVFGAHDQKWWNQDKNKIAYGRFKNMLAELTTDEMGPNYKDEMRLQGLTKKLRFTRDAAGNYQRANAHDIAQGKELFERDLAGNYTNIPAGYDRVATWKEASASAKEINRRSRGSLNQADATTGAGTPSGGITPSQLLTDFQIADIDMRTMASSAVGATRGATANTPPPPPLTTTLGNVSQQAGARSQEVMEQIQRGIDPAEVAEQMNLEPGLKQVMHSASDNINEKMKDLGFDKEAEEFDIGMKKFLDELQQGGLGDLKDLNLSDVKEKFQTRINSLGQIDPSDIPGNSMKKSLEQAQTAIDKMMKLNLPPVPSLDFKDDASWKKFREDAVGELKNTHRQTIVQSDAAGSAVADHFAGQNLNLGNIDQLERAIDGLTTHLQQAGSGDSGTPGMGAFRSPGITDQANVTAMKGALREAVQGAFAQGVRADTSLGSDMNAKRIFAEQMAKATAREMNKTLKPIAAAAAKPAVTNVQNVTNAAPAPTAPPANPSPRPTPPPTPPAPPKTGA